MNHVTWDLCFWFLLARNNAEEALQKLNGAVIGKQSIRLSWGRNPANKQVNRLLTILKTQNVGDSAYPLTQNLLHHDSFNLDSDSGFQIKMTYDLFYWTLLSFVIQAHLSFLFSFFCSLVWQPRADSSNQWNGTYYGGQTYDGYGYAVQPQDPNMYAAAYGAYPAYGNHQQQVSWGFLISR